jgi:hypothetical protein
VKEPMLHAGETIDLTYHVTQKDKAASPFLEVPFQLARGVTRIDVTFVYDKAEDCVLDIGILDSTATEYPTRQGFRGWSGGARAVFHVAVDTATPGYYPGPMPEGGWQLLLGLYKVPSGGVKVDLTVTADDASRPAYCAAPDSNPRRNAAGWYRGDLHCHTFHSDAMGAPELLAENARQSGLDFLAVTDHNTTAQWRYFGPHSTPDLVFVPGMEVTTYRGHANIFGLRDWVDFRLGGSADLAAMLAEVRRQGAVFSVNHDKEPLPWSYDYPRMDCLEVYHGHWLTGNDGILATYDQMLSDGRRISLIGGSDYHQPKELKGPNPFGLGRPTTVLWLEYLDADAVLEGLRSGCGYVTEAPGGPHLAFTVNGQPMGSVLNTPVEVTVSAEVRGASGDRLRWVSEAGVIREETIREDDWQTTFQTRAPRRFLRAEIEAEANRDRLIGEIVDWYNGPNKLQRAQQTLTDGRPVKRVLSNPVFWT